MAVQQKLIDRSHELEKYLEATRRRDFAAADSYIFGIGPAHRRKYSWRQDIGKLRRRPQIIVFYVGLAFGTGVATVLLVLSTWMFRQASPGISQMQFANTMERVLYIGRLALADWPLCGNTSPKGGQSSVLQPLTGGILANVRVQMRRDAAPSYWVFGCELLHGAEDALTRAEPFMHSNKPSTWLRQAVPPASLLAKATAASRSSSSIMGRVPGSGPVVAGVELAHRLVLGFRRSWPDAAGRGQAADAELGVREFEVQQVFEQRRVVPVKELGKDEVPRASQLPGHGEHLVATPLT